MAGLAKAHRSPLSRGGFLHNSGAQKHTFWNHLWLSPNSDGAGRGSQHWAASGCGGLLSRTPRPAVAVGLSRDEGRWGMSGEQRSPAGLTGTALLCPAPAPLTAHGHRMHSHPPQPDLAFQVCFIGTHGSVSRAHRKWDGRPCSCRAEPQSHLCAERSLPAPPQGPHVSQEHKACGAPIWQRPFVLLSPPTLCHTPLSSCCI